MQNQETSLLIIAASETDANMLYATAFFAPDPFIFFQHRRKKYLVMSDLEIDRAKRQADVDRVLSVSQYVAEIKKSGNATPTTVDIVEHLLREKKVDRVTVPANFPTLLADELRNRGFVLEV